MTLYERNFPLEDIKLRNDGDGRTVEAYAAVFDTPAPIYDQDGEYEEVIDRAAFDRALSKAAPNATRQAWKVGVFYNHGRKLDGSGSDRHSIPIGIPIEIRTDPRGLLTVTRYHRNSLAEEVLETIREGSIRSYSFSGAFSRSTPTRPPGGFKRGRDGSLTTVRRLESTLREYGPTPFPAYSDASVLGMRAEQAIVQLFGTLNSDEVARLVAMVRTGAPLDSPDADAPDDSGLVAEDSPLAGRSGRSPREELIAQRAKFLIEFGGGGGA